MVSMLNYFLQNVFFQIQCLSSIIFFYFPYGLWTRNTSSCHSCELTSEAKLFHPRTLWHLFLPLRKLCLSSREDFPLSCLPALFGPLDWLHKKDFYLHLPVWERNLLFLYNRFFVRELSLDPKILNGWNFIEQRVFSGWTFVPHSLIQRDLLPAGNKALTQAANLACSNAVSHKTSDTKEIYLRHYCLYLPPSRGAKISHFLPQWKRLSQL